MNIKLFINKLFVITIIIIIITLQACEKYSIDLSCDSNVICLKIHCADSININCLNNLKADGNKILIITAEVPKEIDKNNNKITFKSATGRFVGELDSITPEVKSVNGQAMVLLQVGNVPGIYRVEAHVSDGTNDYIAFDYIELKPVDGSIIDFDFGITDFSTLTADGETVIRLKTKINQINSIGKKINLRLDGEWTFVNHESNNVDFTLNSAGHVECFLKVGRKAGQCFLTAEFEGFRKSFDFSLIPANPESLVLVVKQQLISAINGSIQVTAYLYRKTGKVSLAIPIAFEASQEAQGSITEVGIFNPPIGKSDIYEVATVTYKTPIDSIVSTMAPIKINAWLLNNPAIKDSINIKVN